MKRKIALVDYTLEGELILKLSDGTQFDSHEMFIRGLHKINREFDEDLEGTEYANSLLIDGLIDVLRSSSVTHVQDVRETEEWTSSWKDYIESYFDKNSHGRTLKGNISAATTSECTDVSDKYFKQFVKAYAAHKNASVVSVEKKISYLQAFWECRLPRKQQVDPSTFANGKRVKIIDKWDRCLREFRSFVTLPQFDEAGNLVTYVAVENMVHGVVVCDPYKKKITGVWEVRVKFPKARRTYKTGRRTVVTNAVITVNVNNLYLLE